MSESSSVLNELNAIGALGIGTYVWRPFEDTLAWSPEMLAIYGVSEAPDIEQGFTDLVYPEDQVRVVAETSAYLEAGDEYAHEFRILRPDGAVRVIHDKGRIDRDAQGRAVCLTGVNIDVTRHRIDQFADARKLADTGAALYDFDIGSGVSWWSEEVFRLFSIRSTETITPHDVARERVHPDDQAITLAEVTRASQEVGPFEFEYRVVLEDGSFRWIRDRGTTIGPINPGTGLAHRVRGNLTDVTDYKLREAKLLTAHDTFHTLVQHAPFGIYLVDSEFRLAFLSEGAKHAFSVFPQPIGMDLEQILRAQWPDDMADDIIAIFRHTLTSGEPYIAPPLVEQRIDLGETEAYDWRIERIVMPDGTFGVACHFYDLSNREAETTRLRTMTERLELAHDAGGVGAWDLNLRTGKTVWDKRMYQLFGREPGSPITVEQWFETVHPDDVAQVRARFETSVQTGDAFEEEFRVIRPDASIHFVVTRGRVVEKDAEGPSRIIGISYDTTERRRLQRELKENHDRLRVVLDNSVAFIGLLDPDGTLLEANSPALLAGGLERGDVIGRKFWDAPWWSYSAAQVKRLKQAAERVRGGQMERYDAVVRMKDDVEMTIDFMLSPIRDSDGRTVQMVASGFDVTDRDAALGRVQILMGEINHRAKNLLTMVQVIARQSKRGDPEKFLPRFEARLLSLASAQDVLLEDSGDHADLERLVQSQLSIFADHESARVRTVGPPVTLNADVVQSIGMAFHELATNAAKYGALSNAEGRVEVTWRTVEDETGTPLLEVDWIEIDGPPVTAPKQNGFGTFVTGGMLEANLSAIVSTDFHPEGLHWTARFTDGFS
ncbi:hypothetical protein A8B78_11985 [Jannaschia sp. EhC01]|nr:hypothetical protein A8B78_11985 [Jannaschia sp. EhC01]